MGINLTSYAIIGAIVFALLGLLGALITIKVVRTLTDKNTSEDYEEEETQPSKSKIRSQSKSVSKPKEELQEEQPQKTMIRKELIFTKVEDITTAQLFIISESQSLTIGRSTDKNSWVIIDDQTISSKHCKIYIIDDSVYIDDLNSTNGTYINKKRIVQPTRLHNQDKIQLGASEYTITIKNY